MGPVSPVAAGPGCVAYLSMEIALGDDIPTFSGGLGVLAGDFLRSAADLGLPVVGVTLLYHHGFFRQELDSSGRQVEQPVHWRPAEHLHHLPDQVKVQVRGRPVVVGVWQRTLTGVDGCTVPVFFLDTLLPENDPADQAIADRLYPATPMERLAQEAVLGLAGPAMLDQLGYHDLAGIHMNEGHAALAPIALLRASRQGDLSHTAPAERRAVQDRCVFTTHTPVPAGHDRFDRDVVGGVLGAELSEALADLGCLQDGQLNMTTLGMAFSGFINGVAQRHGAVSQAMFPDHRVEAITNGVHVATWAAPSTARLLDQHVPRWRHDNAMIRYAGTIALPEIRAARAEAKQALIGEVTRRLGITLDRDTLTIGVARRATPYKRNDLLLASPEHLRTLVEQVGPLQIVYSGKAHPSDEAGKAIIERVNAAASALAGAVTVVYLPDYGMHLASLVVAGVDVWLNNPVAPHEASGTSGMKAAVNGVPSLSVLDGWWLEGCIEGVTGWAIGTDRGPAAEGRIGDPATDGADAGELHRVLHDIVAPLYYQHPDRFAAVCRSAMALNGSFFTAQRMVAEYAARAYRIPAHRCP